MFILVLKIFAVHSVNGKERVALGRFFYEPDLALAYTVFWACIKVTECSHWATPDCKGGWYLWCSHVPSKERKAQNGQTVAVMATCHLAVTKYVVYSSCEHKWYFLSPREATRGPLDHSLQLEVLDPWIKAVFSFLKLTGIRCTSL